MPKQLVPCLFCGGVPCECRGKKASPKKQPASPPSASIPSPSPPVVTDTSNTPDWFASSKPKIEAPVQQQTQDDLLLREALRNLEPLMSPGSVTEYKEIMQPHKNARLAKMRTEVRDSLGRSRKP